MMILVLSLLLSMQTLIRNQRGFVTEGHIYHCFMDRKVGALSTLGVSKQWGVWGTLGKNQKTLFPFKHLKGSIRLLDSIICFYRFKAEEPTREGWSRVILADLRWQFGKRFEKLKRSRGKVVLVGNELRKPRAFAAWLWLTQHTQHAPKSRAGGRQGLGDIALQTSQWLWTRRSRHVFTDKQDQGTGQNFDHEQF